MAGLDAVDPLAVPLPAGTQVVARVDRQLGDRFVKQGAVGNVVSTAKGEVVVDVVGVGRIAYARADVVPRKQGQWRFAVRREADWQALSGASVLESVVGSRAWGLANEGSDEDRRGVFVLPFPWTASVAPPPTDLASADGTITLWEIEKTIRQALRADPNTLEMLFVDEITVRDPIGEWILGARHAFVSQEIFGTFGRYAVAQLRRLEQAARLARHRGEVLSWLREDPELSLDAVGARLAETTRHDPARAREYVKQLYRSMHDQGLLSASDFVSLQRFARDRSTDFELPRELRPKNAYNLIRLILAATRWLQTGEPQLRAEGAVRDELLAIKAGEVPLERVLARAESLVPALEAARTASTLPVRPDLATADALLRRVREEVARRHLAHGPGVFGADAPVLDLSRWEEP